MTHLKYNGTVARGGFLEAFFPRVFRFNKVICRFCDRSPAKLLLNNKGLELFNAGFMPPNKRLTSNSC